MTQLQFIELEFESGRLTGHDAARRILCRLTQSNQQELKDLCPQLRCEIAEALRAMDDGRRSTDESCPTETQVEIGRAWLRKQIEK